MRQGHLLHVVTVVLACIGLLAPAVRAADHNATGAATNAPSTSPQLMPLGADEGGHNGHDRDRKFKLYELQPPDIRPPNALKLAQHLGLSVIQPQRTTARGVVSFADRTGAVRMIFQEADGSLKLFPDLRPSNGGVLGAGGSLVSVASYWLAQNSLLPGETRGLRIGEIITLSNQGATRDATRPVNDVLRSIHFVRMLDGLRVYGEHSILTVDVGRTGVLGLVRTLLPISRHGTPVSILSEAEATERFHRQFAPILAQLRLASPNYTAQVVSTDLIYYEQGQRFVQPVYRFAIQATATTGLVINYYWLVPAVLNTPEPIVNTPPAAEGTLPAFAGPNSNGLPDGSSSVKPPDPIEYGVYVVRDAESGWVNDAWEFHQNIEQPIGPGGSLVVNFQQYFWNEPWLWETDSGEPADEQDANTDTEDPVPDNSRFFVGKVNVALIEAHGAQWIIGTESDCCDLMHLPQISGYGGLNGNGEITDYIIWQACSVIPAPATPTASTTAHLPARSTSGSPSSKACGVPMATGPS
jgi:hypothetical protein